MDKTDSVADFAQPLRSPPIVEWLTFSGEPADNVLRFAQAVHQYAFAYGRHEHGAWMAAYAYGCLADTALDWFEDLEPEIKRDWATLRPALIAKFRCNRFVPSAAAATAGPPLRAPAAAAAPLQPAPSSTSRARVMLVKDNGVILGYLSPPVSDGHSTIQAKPEDALVLNVPVLQSSERPVTMLRMAASEEATESYPFYGLEECADHWRPRACEKGRDGEVFRGRAPALTAHPERLASSRIWSIHKIDESTEELCAQWTGDDGSQKSTTGIYHPGYKTLFWIRQAPASMESRVRMILERF
ncbi:hypothetical protein FRB96_004290 [Tulasnella sp. 330]|nr:hypothetical protein FRB96_004290 [Tulasnella sp. 330]